MSNKILSPRADNVLVKPKKEVKEKTEGGLYLSPSAQNQEQQNMAEVIAVGPGNLDDNGNNVAINLEAGNVVLYSTYSGVKFDFEGEEYLVLKENEIVGVFA